MILGFLWIPMESYGILWTYAIFGDFPLRKALVDREIHWSTGSHMIKELVFLETAH